MPRIKNPNKEQVLFIDEIRAHRRYPNGSVQYLIRWQGLDPSFDSWEPPSCFLDGMAISQYLWGIIDSNGQSH